MEKEKIYMIGYPAKKAYIPFIKFIMKNAEKKDKILDVGGGEGAYSEELKKRGFNVTCIDINKAYIEKAKKRGVKAYVMDAKSLAFPDKSFDISVMFEVLEHIPDPEIVLEEVARVTKKYILITVPNCGGISELKKARLTYDHLLATDHVNFFTKKDLEDLLSKHFQRFSVKEKEPINTIISPWWIRKPISLLYKLKILKPAIYYRLFAVVEINK